MSSNTPEQELLAKRIKHNLENWRELVLPVYEVLIWKDIPLHSSIVFGVSTIIFIAIFLLDPTLLSFVSSLCLCLVLVDYIVPILISKAFNPQSWTGAKEKKLEEVCHDLAVTYTSIRLHIAHFFGLKETRPKLYYSTLISALLVLSWIGNNVNNILLTYIFVTAIAMLPGLKHSGYGKKYWSLVKQLIAQALRSALSKKEKKQ